MVRVRVSVQERLICPKTQHIKLNTIYFVQSCNYYAFFTYMCHDPFILAMPTSIDLTFYQCPAVVLLCS